MKNSKFGVDCFKLVFKPPDRDELGPEIFL
jgi:hypothetical protein